MRAREESIGCVIGINLSGISLNNLMGTKIVAKYGDIM